MTCPGCQGESSHIKVIGNNIVCHNCGGYSESGGVSTDRILTRNSDRLSEQRVQHEADMITPYVVDKDTNQPIVNQDFIDQYPEQSKDTFSKEELKQSGNQDLVKQEQPEDDDVEYSGNEDEAIEEIIQKKS